MNFSTMAQHHGLRHSEPKVAIIIPTKDKFELLMPCIESIVSKTRYVNYEILVVNNGSTDSSTIDYLNSLQSRGHEILDYPFTFNYSKICNFAAQRTKAEYLCFLNNDTQVLEPDWLGDLIDHAIAPGVGVVGSKLLFEDGSIQHLGLAVGISGIASHVYSRHQPSDL
jgi:glycosyltransferase involved in cell wall biosynthesis